MSLDAKADATRHLRAVRDSILSPILYLSHFALRKWARWEDKDSGPVLKSQELCNLTSYMVIIYYLEHV